MAKKDTYYFSHDANADSDPKIIKLMRKHGLAGFGCFWIIIQQLRQQADFELSEADIPDLAYDKHAEESLYKSVVYDFQLFEVTEGKFYSNRLKRSMEEFNAIRDARRKGADKTNSERARKKLEQESERSAPENDTLSERSAPENDTLSERNEIESKPTELNSKELESSKTFPLSEDFKKVLRAFIKSRKPEWTDLLLDRVTPTYYDLIRGKKSFDDHGWEGYVERLITRELLTNDSVKEKSEKNLSANGHPNHWSKAYADKLDGPKWASYVKHLVGLGFKPVKDQVGNVICYEKQNQASNLMPEPTGPRIEGYSQNSSNDKYPN